MRTEAIEFDLELFAHDEKIQAFAAHGAKYDERLPMIINHCLGLKNVKLGAKDRASGNLWNLCGH